MKKEKNIFKNLSSECHTRPDRVSRGMIFNNKEYHTAGSSGRANACPRMTEETGRSMVEMLGVLAVMGVLSVAGIAGYSNAMNKHRANELLNEASKRAAVVAGQLLIRDKGNLSEFTNNDVAGATFATGEVTPSNGQFAITFTTAPDATICAQMKAAAGDNSAMTIAEDCSSITFKSDLSTGSSNNEPVATCTPACQATEECVDGTCITKADPNNSRSCAKNSDCNTWCSANKGANDYGCYCKISASKTYVENACYNNFSGTCATISNAEKEQKYSSSGGFTWWSAKNFCQAIGSHMIKTTDVCGSTANPFNYPSGCTRTPNYYWLQECRCEGENCTCTDNSCTGFIVGDGHVYNAYDRHNDYYTALCE